jgi:hypothetical protein
MVTGFTRSIRSRRQVSDTRKNPDAKHRAAGEAEMSRMVNKVAARAEPDAAE